MHWTFLKEATERRDQVGLGDFDGRTSSGMPASTAEGSRPDRTFFAGEPPGLALRMVVSVSGIRVTVSTPGSYRATFPRARS
jgi:hypothetical protein